MSAVSSKGTKEAAYVCYLKKQGWMQCLMLFRLYHNISVSLSLIYIHNPNNTTEKCLD